MNLPQPFSQLLSQSRSVCDELKITQHDFYASYKLQNTASVRNGEPFQLEAASKLFVTLRVWDKDGNVGLATTSDLTREGLKRAYKQALESAAWITLEHKINFSAEASVELKNIPAAKEGLEPTRITKLVEEILAGEKDILSSHPAIKSVPYNKIQDAISYRLYANSDGALRFQDNTSAYVYFYPLAQEQDRKPRQDGEMEMTSHFQKLDVLKCAKEAAQKTIKHLDYTSIKTGKYLVVFSPDAFLDLLGAFSNIWNAQNVLDKKSLSKEGDIGQTIASTRLSLSDDPLHQENTFPVYFDEEGTPVRKVNIIEKGVLKTFLHSSVTAQRMNSNLTGHTGLGSKLSISSHYLSIENASGTKEDKNWKKSKDTLIYVDQVKSLHAGVNATQGSFSLPFDGFIVEEGKVKSIEAATVAGDFLTLLKDIIHINEERKATPGGICPEVWIKELSITSVSES